MSKIVFTNGCFDIIHSGHIDLLEKSKQLGSKLIVGINSDTSVATIKGKLRPIMKQDERAEILRNLRMVDEVRIFEELTPEALIREIGPDVLVKGGDWKESEIVGADFVRGNGGEVYSIPLKEGFSSTKIIDKILAADGNYEKVNDVIGSDSVTVASIKSHIELFKRVLDEQVSHIEQSAEMILKAVLGGNKVMLCGNGGSAADAQHIAAELIGRYETERKALAAIALTTDTSTLTAVSNDYSFDRIFARQVEGLARPGDILIAISTSGNSPNIVNAIMTARNLGCNIVGLTGEKGRKMAALCDSCVIIPAENTARIQEAHITTGHIWCQIIDKRISDLANSTAQNQ